MNFQTYTIKATRDNLAEIISRASLKNECFIITKFGKPKAMITPIKDKANGPSKEDVNVIFKKTFGMWKNKWSKNKSSIGISNNLREGQYRNE